MSTTNQTVTAKVKHHVQNYFTTLIMLVFIRTNPDEAEANKFGDEIDALISKMMADKDVFDHVTRAKNIFNLDEETGKLTLGKPGQALAILKSRIMQRDLYAASPLDYLYGTGRKDSDKRPFSGDGGRIATKVEVYRDIVAEMGTLLQGELSAEERVAFTEAHNIATEHLEKGITALAAAE